MKTQISTIGIVHDKISDSNLSFSCNLLSGKIEILMEIDNEELHHYLHLLNKLFMERQYQAANAQSFLQLTIREKEIIKLITKGHTSGQIARLLSLSYETIKTHRKNISRKLGCNRLQQLMQYAVFF